MSIVDKVKDIALTELRAKGYAPNPSDVSSIAEQVKELFEAEIERVIAEFKANKPSPVTEELTSVTTNRPIVGSIPTNLKTEPPV